MTALGPSGGKIRVLIADDEPLARRGLELRLASDPNVVIVGQVGDGEAVVHAVRECAPDLLLLDVQMPGMGGFETLKAIPAQLMPLVVFVTAYDHYAIDAFEANAVDYLLKPVDGSRLSKALDKARSILERSYADGHRARLLALLSALSGKPDLTLEEVLETEDPSRLVEATKQISLKDGTRTIRVSPGSVKWVDAAGDYVCIHTDEGTHVVRATIGDLGRRLDTTSFLRIHRSTIVNARRVVSSRPHSNGEAFLTLDCGQELKVSRSYRKTISALVRS